MSLMFRVSNILFKSKDSSIRCIGTDRTKQKYEQKQKQKKKQNKQKLPYRNDGVFKVPTAQSSEQSQLPAKTPKLRHTYLLPSVTHNSNICYNISTTAQHVLYANFCYKILADYGFSLYSKGSNTRGVTIEGKWYLPNKSVPVTGLCRHTSEPSKNINVSESTEVIEECDGVNVVINNTGYRSTIHKDFTKSPQPSILISIFDRTTNWLSEETSYDKILLNKYLYKQLWNNSLSFSTIKWGEERDVQCRHNQLSQGISLLILNRAFVEKYPEISAGKVVYQRAKETSKYIALKPYAASTFLLDQEDQQMDLASFISQRQDLTMEHQEPVFDSLKHILESDYEFWAIRDEENEKFEYFEPDPDKDVEVYNAFVGEI